MTCDYYRHTNTILVFSPLFLYTLSLGEHPYCGHELLEDCGFSYRPEHLMAYGIRHFNWNWPDMTAPHLNILLDIVTIALHEIRAGECPSSFNYPILIYDD